MPNGPAAQVDALYTENRFLDAYQLVKDSWSAPGWIDIAAPDELIIAARLANRLGSPRNYELLHRVASRRFPDHPAVRVSTRWSRTGLDLLTNLQTAEKQPLLNSGIPDLDFQWRVDNAYFWGLACDFRKSHRMLDELQENNPHDPWLHVVRSIVYNMEDLPAIDSALAAFRLSPHRPAVVGQLAQMLLRSNRIDDALSMLSILETGQSYENLVLLAWLHCAKAERSKPVDRYHYAQIAYDLAPKLESLAPLADKRIKRQFAACRFDIALLRGDVAEMQTQTALLKATAFDSISKNLAKNPTGRRILLDYHAVFQKRDACLPTSVAAIAGSFGKPLDADQLAKELTYNGTPLWRVDDWLTQNGFVARIFILTRDHCQKLIENGIPFVMTYSSSLDSGHAVAVVGFDDAAQMLIIHDPASERFGRILLDDLDDFGKPLGPCGLAFVPADQAHRLDLIDDDALFFGQNAQDFWQALHNHNFAEARKVLARMKARDPSSDIFLAFEAHLQTLAKPTNSSIQTLEQLCAKYPHSVDLQRMLLTALNQTRNMARLREFLSSIVRKRVIPGANVSLDAALPPLSCVIQLADIEGLTAQGAPGAVSMLKKILRLSPHSANAYHALGDIYWRQGDLQQALLPSLIAALIARFNEHYVLGFFETQRLLNRADEALEFLHRRVAEYGPLIEGAPCWITLINALESLGDADAAVKTAEEALAAKPDDPDLLVFLVEFHNRMGHWQIAQSLLPRLDPAKHPVHHAKAHVLFHHNRGDWKSALEHCEKWAAHSPDIEPFRWLAWLMRNQKTIFQVIDAATQWSQQRPDNEEFEHLLFNLINEASLEKKREQIVRARIARNSLDPWAWRELAHILIDRVETLPPIDRAPLQKDIDDAVETTVRLDPRNYYTLLLQARRQETRGEITKTLDFLFQAIHINPEPDVAYSLAFNAASNLPKSAQENLIARFAENMLKIPGFLSPSKHVASLIASRFGADAACHWLDQLQSKRPNDPDLVEARAQVLIYHGQGKTSAFEISPILEHAIRQYPRRIELRLLLCKTNAILQQDEKNREILQNAVDSWPLDSRLRLELSNDHSRTGQTDQALDILRQAIFLSPSDAVSHYNYAQRLWTTGHQPQAVERLQNAVKLIPENVHLQRALIQFLVDSNLGDLAVKAARDALSLYPDSCVFLQLLAQTLVDSAKSHDKTEVESLLRQSLKNNFSYYDSADFLAWFLANHERPDDARKVVHDILPTLTDSSRALLRLAWITWRSGQRENAITEMTDALAAYPNNRTGWIWLLESLDAFNSPQKTIDILENVPPLFDADPELNLSRLTLLAKAGQSDDKLEAIWSRIISNFPTWEILWLRRFDWLAERKKWPQARETLEKMRENLPESPAILARSIQIAQQEKNTAAALDIAFTIFKKADDDAHKIAWETLIAVNLYNQAAQRIADRLVTGESFPKGCLRWMVIHSKNVSIIKTQGRSLNRLLFLKWLVDLSIKIQFDPSLTVCIICLDQICDLDPRWVLKFYKKHKDLCQTNAPFWQLISFACINTNNTKRCKAWTLTWKNLRGIQMLALSNYRICFPIAPSRWQYAQIFNLTREVLEKLPRDHTFLFHTLTLCECLIGLNRPDDFLAVFNENRQLLSNPDPNQWLAPFQKNFGVLHRVVVLANILQSQTPGLALTHYQSLLNTTIPHHPILLRAGYKALKPHFGFFKRMFVGKILTVYPALNFLVFITVVATLIMGLYLWVNFKSFF